MRIARVVEVVTGAALVAVATILAPLADPARGQSDDGGDDLTEVVDLDPLDSGDEQNAPVRRAGGSERVATSVAASQQFRDAADTALLATAGDFPDALAATALAAHHDAPVLLTFGDRVPEQVAAELDRLGVEQTILLGGTGVIGEAVADDLAERGYAVDRIAGDHRYGTARELATAAGPAETGEVLLTLGAHDDPDQAWPDAVASGALAASRDQLPTLLTAQDHLPAATRRALDELEAERVLLVGGDTAIPPEIEAELESLGLATERLAATSRYGTSVQVADEALARNEASSHPIVLATGEDFPDALAAGALAASLDAPMALTPSAQLAGVVDDFVRAHGDRWDGGVVVGGTTAASDVVLEQLEAALSGDPRPEPDGRADSEGETESTEGDRADEDQTDGADEGEDQADEGVVDTFEGEASWYGSAFHGQTTACGETFDMHDLTAAHRELPCGTRVRVTNTHNGRQVTVRINDRGPHDPGRVIDLSRAAAEEIGMRASGTAWVRGEVLAD